MADTLAMISVIIPVYNVEMYLSRCVESVLRQTYTNLEIILVDDGSTDHCGEICDSYSRLDGRVRVIHKKNGGLSSARNAGLKVANGEYVGFVDSDDYIAEDMYEILSTAMAEDVDITCCGRIYISSNGRYDKRYVSKAKKYTKGEALEEMLLRRKIGVSACTKLFRRSLFEDVCFPQGRVSEDIPTVYCLIKKARNIVHVGKAKYFYFYRADSISNRAFYLRKVDSVLFRGAICADVRTNYPQFIMQAEALYIQDAIYMIRNIRETCVMGEYAKVEARLKKMLFNMTFRGIVNPYLDSATKRVILRNWFWWMSRSLNRAKTEEKDGTRRTVQYSIQ